MSPLWPFPTKSASQSRRIDQGWDLQYPGIIPVPVLAVESGRLSNGGPDPNGFGPGYPVLTLDKPAPGGPAVYYGHTFTNKLLVGSWVPKGTPIGMTGGPHSGGNAYADSNWLEIGFWNSGPVGNGAEMQAWLSGASAGGTPVSKPSGWTFGQFQDWANSQFPGSGDQFIAWVNSHSGGVLAPVQRDAHTYGSGTFGLTNQTAAGWFSGWLLIGHVEPRIAKALKLAITKAGKSITGQILPGFSKGVSPTGSLDSFLSNLTSRDFVVRAVEVVLGIGIIWVVGGHLLADTNTGKAMARATPKLFKI